MKCLIVEDDFSSQKLLLAMLKGDFECVAVANGRDALESVHQAIKEGSPYDLICMDIEMPEMDGQEALKEIRQIEAHYELNEENRSKIIMTTGNSSGANVLLAAKTGCDGYLVKPFSKHELFSEIERLDLIADDEESSTMIDKVIRFLK